MSWRDDLLPASFRGIRFYVNTHERVSGRRVVVNEYPLRDRVSTEDLGRTVRKYELEAYVTGDDYFYARDALIEVCEDDETVGTLVHPYLGELRVRCMTISVKERATEGRVAVFLLGFVDAGEDKPEAALDTRAAWQVTIRNVLAAANAAFKVVNTVRNLRSGVLLGWLGDFAVSRLGAIAGLPGLSLSTATDAFNSVANLVSSRPDDIANGIQAPYLAIADAAQSVPAPAASASRSSDRIGSTALTSRGEGDDPTRLLGVILLQPPAPRRANAALSAAETVALQALDVYAYGCSIAAAALVMADTDWPNAEAATTARDALIDAADLCAEAAADAGQDDMHAAWRAFTAAAAVDLTARAMRAPVLSSYTVRRPISSLALAHRLYQDPTRADEIVALNNAPHPGFLPATGVAEAA